MVCEYHRSLSNCPILQFAVICDGVKNGVFHKYTDCSAYEWGEEVNVDVVTGAMETSGEKKKHRKENNLDFEAVVEIDSFQSLIDHITMHPDSIHI